MAVAESCTGGLLAAALTDPPGASRTFAGGVVAYDNSVKVGLVGVQPRSLAECGAVSEVVAQEMAQGVRRRLGVDVGLSTTGIAGPDGGTPEKPVGTVWIGVATPEGSWAEVHRFDGDRDTVRAQTMDAACRLALRHLP